MSSAQPPAPTSYQSWWTNIVGAAVPWLAGGPNGQKEGAAWPAVLDYYVNQLYQARYQAYPDLCAVDALPHLGNDRKMIQGAAESNASFRARLKAAFDTWPRAGTACGVLEQLWYFGLTGAVWVQPNGNYYTFGSSTLTPGQDPTPLLTSGNLDQLIAPLTSSVLPPTTSSAGRSIPAGNSWWEFDFNTDFTNRFAIICPSWPFSALALANFVNSDSAAVTWPVPFGSASYSVIYGVPNDTVSLYVDGTTQFTTGVTIRSSAPWTGQVWVTGFANGVNPLNWFGTASFGALQSIITNWRPNALCMGVIALQSGRMWGYPTTNKWGDGGTWGGSTTIVLTGAF